MNTRHDEDYNFLFKSTFHIALMSVMASYPCGRYRSGQDSSTVQIHQGFPSQEQVPNNWGRVRYQASATQDRGDCESINLGHR
jgi:hypothetical protein